MFSISICSLLPSLQESGAFVHMAKENVASNPRTPVLRRHSALWGTRGQNGHSKQVWINPFRVRDIC